MNSPFAMSNGKGPTSQIASASLTVALYEWRFRRAHKTAKTAQVTKGKGADHATTVFQAELGSTLFRSRREERRPLLFDLRATTLGALNLNLALLMFGKS
jgi:hypothetical protein